MSAQAFYANSFNIGRSTGVEPGLDISGDRYNDPSFADPLTQTTASSSDPTGQFNNIPVADPVDAAIDPTVRTTPIADWTVMVYIASDNLESFAIQDFLEMAAVGSQNGVNILLQFDRADASSYADPSYDNNTYGDWTDTRRGIVQAGATPDLGWGTSLGEINTGDPIALSDFLNWGTTHYQAENYGLILWGGHGNGFGTAMDESGDLLTGSEVAAALATLTTDLDLVAADSCLMGTIEFAYELSQDAGVFVASQELVSGYGFEYTSIFAGLTANPQSSAAEFGSSLVNSYANYYSQVDSSFDETISLIDLTALSGLVSAIDQFATTIITSATAYDTYVLDWYRDYFANAFGGGDYPSYVDIGNLFSGLVNFATTYPTYLTAAVSSAAQTVLSTYDAAVLENYSAAPGRSTGLSIYFSNKGYYPTSNYTATHLSLAAHTQWDELLNWSGW